MSQAATPPVADDIAFVLALPADRQAAVLSALLVEFAARQPKPESPIPVRTTDGHPLGRFVPDAERIRSEIALRELSPEEREWLLRPLPTDIDPDDSFTFEELAAIRAKKMGAAAPRRLEPTAPGGGSPATAANANSGR